MPGNDRGRPAEAPSKSISPATDRNQGSGYQQGETPLLPKPTDFATTDDLTGNGTGTYPGLDQAIENAGTDWWSQGALLAIRQLALGGRGFDADHVLDLVGQPTDPHYVGAAFSAAQRARIIEAVGSRVGRDGRLLRVWWGVPSTVREGS